MSALADDAVFAAVEAADARLAGELHWDRQGPAHALPYAVLTSLPAMVESADTAGSMLENCGYRFQVFAARRSTAREILEAVEAATIWQPLGFAGFVECRKRTDDCFEEPERDENGDPVFQGLLDLTVVVDREPGT